MESADREFEIKILGINVDEVKSSLLDIGATYVADVLQRIYTYDLEPSSATFESIMYTIGKEIGDKEKIMAVRRLSLLLEDLSDLLSSEDRLKIAKLSDGLNLQSIIEKIAENNIPAFLFSQDFRNVISNYDTNPNKWVRLRDSGGKAAIALKQIYNRRIINGIRQHSINDVKEIEIQIDSFETGKQLLSELGYFHKNYQEKRRISFILSNNVNVDIDIWPKIPPYLEIEALDEEMVFQAVKKLGFENKDIKVLNADDVFSFYGLDMYSFKELRF